MALEGHKGDSALTETPESTECVAVWRFEPIANISVNVPPPQTRGFVQENEIQIFASLILVEQEKLNHRSRVDGDPQGLGIESIPNMSDVAMS